MSTGNKDSIKISQLTICPLICGEGWTLSCKLQGLSSPPPRSSSFSGSLLLHQTFHFSYPDCNKVVPQRDLQEDSIDTTEFDFTLRSFCIISTPCREPVTSTSRIKFLTQILRVVWTVFVDVLHYSFKTRISKKLLLLFFGGVWVGLKEVCL